MNSTPIRSLQVRLAVRLAALYVAATGLAVGILIYQAYETADTLNDRELSLRAMTRGCPCLQKQRPS
jgi:two-component system, OmpR family, sensor histidine kinase TctE